MKINLKELKLAVEYKQGNDQYKVVLACRSLSSLYNFASGNSAALEGEELVTALITQTKGSGVYRVERFKNGVMNDGAESETQPARVAFSRDGLVAAMDYAQGGQITAEGSKPQVRKYSDFLKAARKEKLVSVSTGVDVPSMVKKIAKTFDGRMKVS